MISTEYVRLMAAYHEWQNSSLYAAADTQLFDHGTHHRGQAHAMLTEAG